MRPARARPRREDEGIMGMVDSDSVKRKTDAVDTTVMKLLSRHFPRVVIPFIDHNVAGEQYRSPHFVFSSSHLGVMSERL